MADDDPPASGPRFHAVVIGVHEFLDERVPRLPATVARDAQALVEVLRGGKKCGLHRDNVMVGINSTSAEMLELISDTSFNVEPDDAVLIVITTHLVSLRRGTNRGGFLMGANTSWGKSERVASSALSLRKLGAALARMCARDVTLVLDVCHGSAADAARVKGRALRPSAQMLDDLSRHGKCHVVSACDPDRGEQSLFPELTDAAALDLLRPPSPEMEAEESDDAEFEDEEMTDVELAEREERRRLRKERNKERKRERKRAAQEHRARVEQAELVRRLADKDHAVSASLLLGALSGGARGLWRGLELEGKASEDGGEEAEGEVEEEDGDSDSELPQTDDELPLSDEEAEGPRDDDLDDEEQEPPRDTLKVGDLVQYFRDRIAALRYPLTPLHFGHARGDGETAVTPVPPVPPQPFMPIHIKHTVDSIDIAWGEEDEAGRVPVTQTQYEVQYRNLGSRRLLWQSRTPVWHNYFHLGRVPGSVDLVFRVRAKNAAGWSDWSELSDPIRAGRTPPMAAEARVQLALRGGPRSILVMLGHFPLDANLHRIACRKLSALYAQGKVTRNSIARELVEYLVPVLQRFSADAELMRVGCVVIRRACTGRMGTAGRAVELGLPKLVADAQKLFSFDEQLQTAMRELLRVLGPALPVEEDRAVVVAAPPPRRRRNMRAPPMPRGVGKLAVKR